MFFDHLPGAGYVCAHRGARALAPENTMLAAELGHTLGADYWETDVHKLDDGSLVVFHDDELDRTTNIADLTEFASRKPWPTHAFTREELDRVDAGAWFPPRDEYGTVKKGEVPQDVLEQMEGQRIPTLRGVLEFSRKHDFPINIEIKDQLQSPGDLSIVEDVLEMVYRTGARDLTLISSFNHDYLAEARRIDSAMPLAVLVEEEHPDNIVEYVRSLGADCYHPDWEITDPDMARSLIAKGLKVSPYTVNDMDMAMDFVDAGCFGIITDHTHTLLSWLDQRRRTTAVMRDR